MRKKSKTADATGGISVSSNLRRGALNWEPPYPEGEDEASMTKHREALQAEWHQKTPNKENIEKWMMLTYPERRRKMNKQIGIPDLKAEYPALFDFYQVKTVL